MDGKTSIYPDAATVFAGVCACFFTVVGVCGNLITILALVNSPKIRGHATTAFVLSLCISDLLFCSFSLPLTAVRFFAQKWTLGDDLCRIFPVIFYGNVAVSLLSMVCITINRYILIGCHNIYGRLYRRQWIIVQLACVWFVSFLLLLPPYLGVWGEMGLDEVTFSCTILKKNGRSIKKPLFLLGFLLPCLVIIASYSCIYIKVLQQKRKMKCHRQFVINSSNAENLASDTRKDREDSRLTLMMMTIFVCFLICFLPLMLANVVDDERKTSYPWLHIVASVMAWASSVINPIIYAASNRNYRIAYMRLFRRVKFWNHDVVSTMPSKTKHSKELSGPARSTPPALLCGTGNRDNRTEHFPTYSV
ncbi:protein trapped in endoderm-1-like [Musca domestica]|uniref:Protein trapped in endoderm-1 n=1 Tax=Musca domestica TaxID=7370 RepID=A0A1I8MNM5_MUSDO|nr:protein trapped in endoderm-1 [Musca domestica]XP_058985287.1 protein trapped in endoderm-1-like [Musca domestica]